MATMISISVKAEKWRVTGDGWRAQKEFRTHVAAGRSPAFDARLNNFIA
jgi:ribosomal protein L35